MALKMAELVSVIIPTYNRNETLKASINSVLAQSFVELELIVVDDCSTEDVEGVVSGFKDHRLRYIRRHTNGGAAAARNTGLAEAKGSYIAFQDSDDLWLPSKLDRQMRQLASLPRQVGAVTGAKILYQHASVCSENARKVSLEPSPGTALTLEEDQLGHLLRENRLSVQNALFRRSSYPGSDWFDPCARANEDWDFAVRLAQRTKIYEDGEPVVLAFTSPDSISRNARRQQIGVVRILRKNRSLRHSYSGQFALMLFYLGRFLRTTNKRRMGFRFIAAALLAHPLVAWHVFSSRIRRKIRTLLSHPTVSKLPSVRL